LRTEVDPMSNAIVGEPEVLKKSASFQEYPGDALRFFETCAVKLRRWPLIARDLCVGGNSRL
jgi:hypothetical protein